MKELHTILSAGIDKVIQDNHLAEQITDDLLEYSFNFKLLRYELWDHLDTYFSSDAVAYQYIDKIIVEIGDFIQNVSPNSFTDEMRETYHQCKQGLPTTRQQLQVQE